LPLFGVSAGGGGAEPKLFTQPTGRLAAVEAAAREVAASSGFVVHALYFSKSGGTMKRTGVHILLWLAASACPLSVWPAAAQPPGQPSPVGRIVGHLDGISQDGDHFFISGWACQQGQKKSLTVQVYGADPKTPSKRSLLRVQFANLYSEPAIAQACRVGEGGRHRFARLPVLDAPHPDFPRLPGAYRSLAGHPRVFMTASDLKDLVTRINRPGSYWGKRSGRVECPALLTVVFAILSALPQSRPAGHPRPPHRRPRGRARHIAGARQSKA